jgi:hypothetical protein
MSSEEKPHEDSVAADFYKPDNFDDCVVIARQPRTMVYINPSGQAVIRQDADEFGEADPFVVISLEHIETLIAALRQTARTIAEALKEDPQAFKLPDEPEEAPLPPKPIAAPPPPLPPMPSLREQIEAALLADGSRSNRDVAADLGCGETTVRRIRATLNAPSPAPRAAPSLRLAHPSAPNGAPLAHPDGAPALDADATLFTNGMENSPAHAR